jgi:hypothetical protein
MASSNFYENWTKLLEEKGLSWPDGSMGDEIKRLFNDHSGWAFFHEYVKNSASWFGGSSSFRIKLFLMISFSLGLIPKDSGFEDLESTIINMFRPRSFDGRFFKKYFVRPSPDKLKEGLLDLLVDAEQRKEGKKSGPQSYEGSIIVRPLHFLMFVTFADKKYAREKMAPEQYALFAIMEDLDIKEGSTFADLDYCLEAVNLYVHLGKMEIIIGQEGGSNEDKNKKMAINIINYAQSLQPMLVYHLNKQLTEDEMYGFKQKLIDSVIRINEVISFDQKIDEIKDMVAKEKQLVKYFKENIALEQHAIDVMAERQNIPKEKVLHKIQSFYNILAHMKEKGIPFTDMTITRLCYDLEPLFAMTLLFALNTGIGSTRDWWFFYDSIIRTDGILRSKMNEIAKQFVETTPVSSSSEN